VAGDGTAAPLVSLCVPIWRSGFIRCSFAAKQAERTMSDQRPDCRSRRLAAAVASHFRVPVEIAGIPAPGKPAERYVPSNRRARNELGLIERVGLPDADRTNRKLPCLRCGAGHEPRGAGHRAQAPRARSLATSRRWSLSCVLLSCLTAGARPAR